MTAREFYEIRRDLGITQVELAEELGRSLRAVCYYESGGRPINKTVEKLMLMLAQENRHDESRESSHTEYSRNKET